MLGAKLVSNPMMRPSQIRKSTQEIENPRQELENKIPVENNFDNVIKSSNPIIKKKKPKLKQMDFDEKSPQTYQRDSVLSNIEQSPKKIVEKKDEEEFIIQPNKISLNKEEEIAPLKVENRNTLDQIKETVLERKKNLFDDVDVKETNSKVEEKSEIISQEKKKNLFDDLPEKSDINTQQKKKNLFDDLPEKSEIISQEKKKNLFDDLPEKSDINTQQKKKNLFEDIPEKEITVKNNEPTLKKSIFDFDDTEVTLPTKKQENKDKENKASKNNKIQFLFDE
jgi:hypothetical protein